MTTNFALTATLIAGGLFAAILLFLEIGRRLGVRTAARDRPRLLSRSPARST